ncbi:MAG: substrate-binding domain-containing protein, partial [Clostridia bacterium]|nr:substrate-binding domain-containing protein [Clostridia bacterium]
ADGYRQMIAYYPKHPEITAIICGSDTIAIGVTKALLTLGVRVPQDVSVIGFDGIDAASYYHPAIGSIVQPSKEMAKKGVSLLFKMLDGEAGGHVVCPCSLECRDTVAANWKTEKV